MKKNQYYILLTILLVLLIASNVESKPRKNYQKLDITKVKYFMGDSKAKLKYSPEEYINANWKDISQLTLKEHRNHDEMWMRFQIPDIDYENPALYFYSKYMSGYEVYLVPERKLSFLPIWASDKNLK